MRIRNIRYGFRLTKLLSPKGCKDFFSKLVRPVNEFVQCPCLNRNDPPFVQKFQVSRRAQSCSRIVQPSREVRRATVRGCEKQRLGPSTTEIHHSPHAVGYLAPCLCKKCRPVILHVSGVSGLESSPNAFLSTLYHGERLPHFLNKSNDSVFSLCVIN